MRDGSVIGWIVAGAITGVLLLFIFFAGPQRADRPQISDVPAQAPAGTVGSGPAR